MGGAGGAAGSARRCGGGTGGLPPGGGRAGGGGAVVVVLRLPSPAVAGGGVRGLRGDTMATRSRGRLSRRARRHPREAAGRRPSVGPCPRCPLPPPPWDGGFRRRPRPGRAGG